MRRWLQPARALPVTLRPVGGETINSYTRRLSAANGLVPTAVLRSLGQITQASGHHLLARDSWLNGQAIDRLEALSAISRPRLVRALPALQQGEPPPRFPELPGDRPALHCYVPEPRPWLACRACTLRASLGTTPAALVRPQASPLICRRHQRWLGTADEPADISIPGVPEILTASRRLQKLRSSTSPRLADDCVDAAWNITRAWAREPHCRPELRARWQARAGKLGPDTLHSSRVVTFPEAIALAEILSDPGWRRYVAITPTRRAGQFYRRVSARIGEETYRAPTADDPVLAWARHYRDSLSADPGPDSSQELAASGATR